MATALRRLLLLSPLCYNVLKQTLTSACRFEMGYSRLDIRIAPKHRKHPVSNPQPVRPQNVPFDHPQS